jgi:hypothetical protein
VKIRLRPLVIGGSFLKKASGKHQAGINGSNKTALKNALA